MDEIFANYSFHVRNHGYAYTPVQAILLLPDLQTIYLSVVSLIRLASCYEAWVGTYLATRNLWIHATFLRGLYSHKRHKLVSGIGELHPRNMLCNNVYIRNEAAFVVCAARRTEPLPVTVSRLRKAQQYSRVSDVFGGYSGDMLLPPPYERPRSAQNHPPYGSCWRSRTLPRCSCLLKCLNALLA